MNNTIRICLAQINPVLGDIKGNSENIIKYIDKAKKCGADIVAFPELCLCGYPPEDLLLKSHFIEENRFYLNEIAKSTKPRRRGAGSILAIVGFPHRERGRLFNSAAIIYNGRLVGIYHKIILPNYGVFDEKRYFHAGDTCPVMTFNKDVKIGINICEDIWMAKGPHRVQARKGGAGVIINISASPYHMKKIITRQNILRKRAKETGAYMLYCNQAGGQDELVFDGASLAFDNKGRLLARGRQFEEDMVLVDIDLSGKKKKQARLKGKEKCAANIIEKRHTLLEEVYAALVLGTRDYVRKNNFKKAVFGLSGGIDSALAALILADALGKGNVTAVIMPSEYTSSQSLHDAAIIVKALGIKSITLPIDDIRKGYLSRFKKVFKGMRAGVAEENIQARIRGNFLMGLSNKFGWLVVATGNKSELSTGYCTLYGDMAGGFAVLKDVPKTLVYELAKYRNANSPKRIIPEGVFTRPPSAELKRDQTDQDTLPPYPVLDKIIEQYIENDRSMDHIVKNGFGRSTVRKVISLIDKNEYKRRQAPIGIKITPKAFGKDRRMPITNKFSK